MSLKFAILGLLATEQLSGYEVTRAFERSVGYFWHARSQQIYPELARLEEAGMVAGEVVPQVGRPDKRVYTITPEGVQSLREWVLTPSPMGFVKDEFMLKVWSYGLVEPQEAMEALARQREQHEQRLAQYRSIRAMIDSLDAEQSASVPLGAWLTISGGIAFETSFVAWCRETEALLEERAAATRPQEATP